MYNFLVKHKETRVLERKYYTRNVSNEFRTGQGECTLRIVRRETLSFLEHNVIVVNKRHKKTFKKNVGLN